MENQRVRLTKQLLRESLMQLLVKEDINKISICEICKHAQINRSTFYRYYGSQYELLTDVELMILTQIENYLNVGAQVSGLSKMVLMLSYFEENREHCSLLLNNSIDKGFPEKLMNLPAVKSQMLELLNEKYRPNEVYYMYSLIVNSGFEMIRKWLNKEHRESPDQMAEFIENTIQKLL